MRARSSGSHPDLALAILDQSELRLVVFIVARKSRPGAVDRSDGCILYVWLIGPEVVTGITNEF